MRLRWVLFLMPIVCLGCASPRAVLVNDQGQHITCAATSVGIVGGIVAQSRFDNCIADAKQKGYRIEYQE
jgi:uncharacterized protein YcfL